MFTHTFDSVRAESTLNSRVAFAQSMLRLELIAASLGMKTAVGEPKPGGDYTYDFRSVSEDGNGKKTQPGKTSSVRTPNGNGDPFARAQDGPFERLEARMDELKRDVTQLLAALPVPAGGDPSFSSSAASPKAREIMDAQLARAPKGFDGLTSAVINPHARVRSKQRALRAAQAATKFSASAGAAVAAVPRNLERQISRIVR